MKYIVVSALIVCSLQGFGATDDLPEQTMTIVRRAANNPLSDQDREALVKVFPQLGKGHSPIIKAPSKDIYSICLMTGDWPEYNPNGKKIR